jgi:ATP-binding cassette, subfamily B (MDR/TAP), member 1
MERFYERASGSILLDGTPIEEYDLRSMRRQIGYISQEAVLFNTTIRENLLFSVPDATEGEMIEALKMASAYSFVQALPRGIDTPVGSGGGQLSGGQKQRIAIARAFLKKPKVLLLDEATSALDKVNERAVQGAIDRFRKEQAGGVTIIAIAHRLATIRDADKIVVLKDGRLVEVGNHEQLIAEHPDGVYHGFVKKQESAEADTAE